MNKNRLFLFLLLFPIIIQAQDQFQVFFDSNLDEMNDMSKDQLNLKIKENKDLEVLKIEGYTDEVGEPENNYKLSLKRAQSVYQTLKNNQVKCTDDIEIKALGELFSDSKNLDLNRKVTIFFKTPKNSNVQSSENNIVEEVVKKDEIREKIAKEEVPKEEVSKIVTNTIPLNIKVKNAKVGDIIKVENLNFYLDSFTFLPKSSESLGELLYIMNTNEKLYVEIQGHNCCMPFDTKDLSTKRAKAVYDYLKENGVKKARISYKGFDTTKPIYPVPEKNEDQRIANRRVDILILKN